MSRIARSHRLGARNGTVHRLRRTAPSRSEPAQSVAPRHPRAGASLRAPATRRSAADRREEAGPHPARRRLAATLCGAGYASPPHSSRHTTDQPQGGPLHPNLAPWLGLWLRPPEVRPSLRALADYFRWHNRRRSHSSLGWPPTLQPGLTRSRSLQLVGAGTERARSEAPVRRFVRQDHSCRAREPYLGPASPPAPDTTDARPLDRLAAAPARVRATSHRLDARGRTATCCTSDVKKLGRLPRGRGKRFGPGFAETQSGPHFRRSRGQPLRRARRPRPSRAHRQRKGVHLPSLHLDRYRRKLRPHWTSPHHPQPNGKAKRIIQTLQHGWTDARRHRSNPKRSRALAIWLDHDNRARPHGGIRGGRRHDECAFRTNRDAAQSSDAGGRRCRCSCGRGWSTSCHRLPLVATLPE